MKLYPAIFCFVFICHSNGLGNVLRVPAEFSTIQAGIDAANDRDTVLVANGTYIGEGNKDLDYQGKSIYVMSENGAGKTIIDCGNEGRGFYFHNDEDSLATIKGFTIRNGYVTGDWPEDSGGGILCDAASPTILNCIITENTAEGTGGGIYCLYSSEVSIIGCTVSKNVGNVCIGGIDNAGSIIDCKILDNSSPLYAGGVWVTETELISCTIMNNTGGGVDIHGNSIISDCIISGNTKDYNGSGIDIGSGHPIITNCVITENSSGGYNGSGVYCDSESGFTLSDCIIAGNVGSGVRAYGYPDITNCTIVGNLNSGVKCSGSYAYATIVNCIVWDNGGPEIDDDNGWTEVDYSDVQGAIWPGTGNIMSNPRFVEPKKGDFRLLPESPCIDAGDPLFEVPPGGGLRIDMGAYEYYHGFNFMKGAMSKTRRVPQDYPTIQEAIDAAVFLDTILVADGTYTGEGNKNIDFHGKTIFVQSENGPNATVIDCENDGRGFFFLLFFEPPMAQLVGFTIKNGYVDYGGGGIYCSNTSPIIQKCRIIDCKADRFGGGIYCHYSNTVIGDCLIANNNTTYGGGAYYFYEDCFIQIYNTTFANNTASQKGGGIYCRTSSSIINCTVYENNALEGSGLYCDREASPIITNCVFRDDPETEIYNEPGANPVITYSNIMGSWPGEGNIDADPLFLDPEHGDFHLTIDSPCIDTGTSNGAPEFDFEGDPRPFGDGVDMGADEYTGKYLVELLSAYSHAPLTINR